MYQEEILKYYSRKDVQKAILASCDGREIVPVMATGHFGTRPNAVYYQRDIEAMIKQGAVSLHGSVERWKNPLHLNKELKVKQLDEMRTGWDLIIDIDCDHGLEYSQKAALAIVKTLETFGIKNYSIKYSGNRGFHLGIPFEVFPEKLDFKALAVQFPDVPKMLIEYIEQYIEKDLRESFGVEDPFKILKLDSQVLSSRHLVRLPYCLHRKTWRVSLPISKEQLKSFDPSIAEPANVKVDHHFLQPNFDTSDQEAVELLQAAIFWNSRKKQEKKAEFISNRKLPEKAIPQDYFPPCINNILNGIKDGKKRSVFVLATYLYNIGWKEEDVQTFLYEWNQSLEEPLKSHLIEGTLKNQRTRESPQMSPNCANPGFYKDYQVCTPDAFCKNIKNPVIYTLNKVKNQRRYGKKKRGPKPKKQENKSVKKEQPTKNSQSAPADQPTSPSTKNKE